MRSADTSVEAHERQIAVLRSMSSGERLAVALRSSQEMLHLAVDRIRMRHPEYAEHEVRWAFLRWRVGDDLFGRIWLDAPLLDP